MRDYPQATPIDGRFGLLDMPAEIGKSLTPDVLDEAGEVGWELVTITTNNVAYLRRAVDAQASAPGASAARGAWGEARSHPPQYFQRRPFGPSPSIKNRASDPLEHQRSLAFESPSIVANRPF